jgi:hypothetical protein
MNNWKTIVREHERRLEPTDSKSTVSVGGSSIDLEDPQTTQNIGGSILGANVHGVPRGKEAYQARQLGETWAMEIVKNAINDQLAGGSLGMATPDNEESSRAARDLWALFRDLLQGPHLQGDDWNDLVSAAVSDMVDVGHGYWEPIPSADDSLPVAALKPVDALTVRHNVTEKGAFDEDAPFYQAAFQSHGGQIVEVGSGDLTALDEDDLVMMRYPGSNRSNRVYPRAPGMQVQAALEHLTHSTIHSTRYYNDNELPAGFIQLMQANDSTIEDVKETIKNAAGDPRKAGVIGGDGPAKWIEMGGTSLNLDVIGEQKWFLQLVLACFGLTKGEIAMTEDVNRNTADAELEIVHKRVTGGFIETITDAVTNQVFRQFESYQALPDDQRFQLDIRYTDPRQERLREEHFRERYEAGGLTYTEYRQQLGEDPGDTVVEVDGIEVDYGDHPKFVIEEQIRDARRRNDA